MQIQGRNPIIEALNAGVKIKKVFVKEGEIDPKLSSIIDQLLTKGIDIKYKSKRHLNKLSQGPIHQGIIAITQEVPQKNLEEVIQELGNIDPFFIYIRESLNEANIGAIIRTAEASGCNGIILPPKIELSPVMLRTSMGAALHIPIINSNLFQTIKYLRSQNIKIIGIETTGDKYYYEADLKGPVMLIIGGEDRSLSSEILSKCDTVVKIPMKGKVNSLNMSVAASIVMYEKLRQG